MPSSTNISSPRSMTTSEESYSAWPDSVEHNAKTDDQVEILRLKKELKRTLEERDLLKNRCRFNLSMQRFCSQSLLVF